MGAFARVEVAIRSVWARVAPESAERYRRLAETQMKLEATRSFRTWSHVLTLDPRDLGARERYAEALFAEGDWTTSLQVWREWDQFRSELAVERLLDRLPLTILGRTFTKRIGHTALLDLYVKERLLAGESLSRSVVLTHPEAIMNCAYLEYWRQYLRIVVVDYAVYERLRPVIELVEMSMQAWRRPDGGNRILRAGRS